MKKIVTSLMMAAFVLFVATSCEPVEKEAQTRTIIYTVQDNASVSRSEQVTLHSDSEWDALLDQLLVYAEQGSRVSFYNAERSQDANSSVQSKDSHTISTTNRDEFKRWCREMENLGLTVVIDYDRNTGTWTGTAYSVAPPQSLSNNIVTYVSVRGMDGSLDDCVWVNRVIISVDTVYHTLFITKMGNFINMPTGIFYNARVTDTLLTYHAPHSDEYDTLIFKRLGGDTILLSERQQYCSTAYLDHIDYCKFVPTDDYELWVMMQDYQTWWHYVTMHVALNSCSSTTYSFIGQMDVMSYPEGNWVFFKNGPFQCEGGIDIGCDTCDEAFNFINSLGETHQFILERINDDFVVWRTLDQRRYTFMRNGCAQYFPQN